MYLVQLGLKENQFSGIILVKPKNIFVRLINNRVIITRPKITWCTHVWLINNRMIIIVLVRPQNISVRLINNLVIIVRPKGTCCMHVC